MRSELRRFQAFDILLVSGTFVLLSIPIGAVWSYLRIGVFSWSFVREAQFFLAFVFLVGWTLNNYSTDLPGEEDSSSPSNDLLSGKVNEFADEIEQDRQTQVAQFETDRDQGDSRVVFPFPLPSHRERIYHAFTDGTITVEEHAPGLDTYLLALGVSLVIIALGGEFGWVSVPLL